MLHHVFHDRRHAGRALARHLKDLHGTPDVILLALPRGGVPVAFEIAKELHAPLDVFVVRKLGVPGQEELAMGAVASGGAVALNQPVLALLRIASDEVDEVLQAELAEVERRARAYRGTGPMPALRGRIVVLVDDGIATGSTMTAAVNAVRRLGPASVIVAAPVMSRDAFTALRRIADRVECVVLPDDFGSVGSYYEDFTQTSDEEVVTLLGADATLQHTPASAALSIPCGSVSLAADLAVPEEPRGLVVFAHGSGSGRRSRRNQKVSAALNGRGFATLLFDLLTADEDRLDRETMSLRFDIPFLARRLEQVTHWIGTQPLTGDLPVAYFGASTGAAAALVAAARLPDLVHAVVSRGGRPDLAGAALRHVEAPTLLIVGGADDAVLALNRRAAALIGSRTVRLRVIPGATHLFEEAGAMEQVADLAGDWFTEHLGVMAAAES